MDRELEHKFGTGFKKSLLKLADSIYIYSHEKDTIPAYFCDRAPSYWKSKKVLTNDFFSNFHLPPNCPKNRNGYETAIRILFTVNTNGHASDYRFYYSDNLPISKECISALKQQITNAFNRLNKWKPGILGNKKVISFGDLLLDPFKKEIW
jgi:hypothetical protein